jgi:hypothetical protein
MSKKWKTFRITNNFDNSAVEISWDGIKRKDAVNEVKELAEKNNKEILDYIIKER